MMSVAAMLLSGFLLGQVAEKKPHPGVDQNRVDKALQKGAAWLLGASHPEFYEFADRKMRHHEMVLYTLLNSGADRNAPKFQALLKEVLTTPLERTYCVSVQAMLLQEMDAEGYQWRIGQCCQFLVDNQCPNGQWSYGTPTSFSKDIATPTRRNVETGSSGGVVDFGNRGRTTTTASKKPKKSIRIRQKRTGPAAGDNSNSQYAALGLRACLESNVNPPKGTLGKALVWWEKTQTRDGAWRYEEDKGEDEAMSMTAGAAASIIIYRHHLRRNWKRAPSVNGAVTWLASNFTVKEHPGDPKWTYYYLYALERTGILAAIDKIGPHDWYLEGALHLLDTQNEDGSWTPKGRAYPNQKTWDTCFALLFLARATRPMVASIDRGSR